MLNSTANTFNRIIELKFLVSMFFIERVFFMLDGKRD